MRRVPPVCQLGSRPQFGGEVAATRIYFGRIVGSPPGLPGGGMTGILPVLGVGARISGSTPVGGQSTPSDLASLSPSGSARGRWPWRPAARWSLVAARAEVETHTSRHDAREHRDSTAFWARWPMDAGAYVIRQEIRFLHNASLKGRRERNTLCHR